MARPRFAGTETDEDDPRTLENFLERELPQTYSVFCQELIQHQSVWLSSPEAPRLPPPTRRALLDHPCMNDLTQSSGGPFEIISRDDFHYLYVSQAVARQCLTSQSLDPIPAHLRRGTRLLAMDAWPYDQHTGSAILSKYHNNGWSDATLQDIEYFVAIPRTTLFQKPRNDGNVSIRTGAFGPFDILVIGRPLLIAEEEEEEDEGEDE